MSEMHVSPNFDMDDIRHIREENSPRHKKMTAQELHEELTLSTKSFFERLNSMQEKPSA